ncbi:unnamed protein product [Symbiodinium natans]|uniref:Uncharacterized protein n=1 Tax=Symbiodinium natans TaxID=878477 RepID=A0A812P830_9DINO|nr:unnamed protein product [Symbiodinium natans]
MLGSALVPAPATEAPSPLWLAEEDFNGCTEGKAFELGRMDRIVCGVVTPEGRHTRYLVLHQHLLLLVQPDLVQPGWAVARTLVPLRYVDAQVDRTDHRMLRLTLRLAQGAACPGEASAFDPGAADGEGTSKTSCFLLTLSFEDNQRRLFAENHLCKYRKAVREHLSANVEKFVDDLCGQ